MAKLPVKYTNIGAYIAHKGPLGINQKVVLASNIDASTNKLIIDSYTNPETGVINESIKFAGETPAGTMCYVKLPVERLNDIQLFVDGNRALLEVQIVPQVYRLPQSESIVGSSLL